MVGERLRRFRLARGMSLGDLEAAIDGLVSSQTLSKYEQGELQPTAVFLIQIAAALGVKSSQLLDESFCDTETEQPLKHTVDPPTDKLSERRRFLQLPRAERERILSEQAEGMVDFYENDTEWREWSVGRIIEYEIPKSETARNPEYNFDLIAKVLLTLSRKMALHYQQTSPHC